MAYWHPHVWKRGPGSNEMSWELEAAFINKTGPPDVILYGDLPDPSRPAQAVVKVGAVAVNPIDTYIRGGAVAMPLAFPAIIGIDLAGTVVACGNEVRSIARRSGLGEQPGNGRPARMVRRAGRRR